MIALAAAQLHERRRSLLAWGLPLGLWSAFVVAIFPSVEDALAKAVADYPRRSSRPSASPSWRASSST